MEVELKLLLRDRRELDALRAALGEALGVERQHNLYFDDAEGLWREAGMAVRLRRSESGVELTVKTAGEAREGFVQRGEWEKAVDPERWPELSRGGGSLRAEILPLLAPPLGPGLTDALLSAELHPVGAMDNVRRVHAVPGAVEGLRAELDETSYPNGQVTYEVELELPDGVEAAAASAQLRDCFRRARISWRPSLESKRARLEMVLGGRRIEEIAEDEPESPGD